MRKLKGLLVCFGILAVLGSSYQCTKDSLSLESNLHVPRSVQQIAMDRYIPIHAGEHSGELGTFHPLVIHFDTDGLLHLKQQDPEKFQFLNESLVPAVVKYLSQTFKVRETQLNRVSVDTCGKVKVKDSLKQDIKADLILFFTALGDKNDSFIAYASACQLHKTTLRLVVGRVNMNPHHISLDRKMWQRQFTTVLHESFHIMGFAKDLFQYFIDPITQKRKQESDTLLIRTGEKFPYLIKSPKVLALGKDHFKCDTLEGVPAEDDSSSGSPGSHWEKVVLGNEIMVPTATNKVISKFSLKLLEDSGWYQVDYNMGEPFLWGIRAGCDIIKGDCNINGNKCAKIGEKGCFYDYTFKANCSSDVFQNKCSFFTGTDYTRHDCRQPANRDNFSEALGEFHGNKSRCFTGQMVANGFIHRNYCYFSSCEAGKVKILIGKKTYECLSSGQKIEPIGIKGHVICPSYRDFCEHDANSCKNDCSMNGRCQFNKRCWCFPGFKGDDCSEIVKNSTVPSKAKQISSKNLKVSGVQSNTGLTSPKTETNWWDDLFRSQEQPPNLTR